MQISISVPDFIVRAVSGKAAVLITGAAVTGLVHCVGVLGHYSPALASLVGDPVILADRCDIALMILIASLGNRFHLDLGSNLGRIAEATITAVEASAAQDLNAHGIIPPAIPVLPAAPAAAPAPVPAVSATGGPSPASPENVEVVGS